MKENEILIITNDFPPYFSGGISNYYYNLAKNLPYVNVKVIAPWCPSAKEHDLSECLSVSRVFVPIHSTIFGRSIQTLILLLAALLESFRCNVSAVIIGHLYLAPIGYVLNILRRIPYTIIMHGGEPKRYSLNKPLKYFIRVLVNSSIFIITNSVFTEKEVLEGWGYKGSIYVLHPGVSIERYFPKVMERREYFGKEDIFVLLSVGTLVQRKGHRNTLKAISMIKGEIPNIKYLIVGKGPEMENLKVLAYRELDLDESVEFLGFLDDDKLIEYYNLADVFIMPSRITEDKFGTEGFGIVYLEANACGKPVIAGNSGGVSDAVIDGMTGILVNPDSVDDIAEAILHLYKNPEDAKLMGEKGRTRIVDEFQWKDIAKRFHSILRKHIPSNMT